MKKLFSLCLLAFWATVAFGQQAETRATMIGGNWFGEELPNFNQNFHFTEVEFRYSKDRPTKPNTLWVSGMVRNWSRYRTAVTSFGAGVRYSAELSSGFTKVDFGGYIVGQARSKRAALGGAFDFLAEFGHGTLKPVVYTSFEVGKLGLYADLSVGFRTKKLDGVIGSSFAIGGEYARMTYQVSGGIRLGAMYTWDKPTNDILEKYDLERYRRNGIGFLVQVKI